MSMRCKNFGIVLHAPYGLEPFQIETVHTRKGHGWWSMNRKLAVKLRDQLTKAIEREDRKHEKTKVTVRFGK